MSELERPTESSAPKKQSARKRSGPAGGAKRKAASSNPATSKKKAPARRATSGKKATARAKATPPPRSISADERIRMISEAAYYRAEQRGFREGDPERDWLEAEAEVDALLLRGRSGKE